VRNGITTRRLHTCPANDGQELRNSKVGSEGSEKERKSNRSIRENHEQSGAIDNGKPSELAKPCDGKCTTQDRHEGMFGVVCTRCNYDDLGSLTEY
jgi:hypothetical protein